LGLPYFCHYKMLQTHLHFLPCFRESWILLLDIRNQDLGAECAHSYCGIIYLKPSQRTKKYIHISTYTYTDVDTIHIFMNISVCNHVY
jgi:hypothetical protein